MATTLSPPAPGWREPDAEALSLEVAGDAAAARGDDREALSCWSEALAALTSLPRPVEAARVASKMAVSEEHLGEAEAAIGK